MPSWKRVIVSGSSAHLNQITGSGGVKLPDSVRLNFGDANDMKIYHSGNHSIIQDTGTGNLRIKASIVNIQGTSAAEDIATFTEDGGVELYYDDSKKLETIRTGVDVTGAITASGDISGSSSSTGSFGSVHVADKIGIGTTSPGKTLDIVGTFRVSSDTFLQSHTYLPDNKHLYLGTGADSSIVQTGSVMKINNTAGNMELQIDGTTALTLADTTGNATFAGNVSGSSTSILTMSEISASGDIVADGDIIAYNASDRKLKDNLQVIQGSLDKIGEINGYEFDWNEKSPGWARERGHDIGVIAQEVQKVVPEIVVERKNGYLGVDYKRLVPLLIESVKELKEEVEELKKKVN